MSFRPRRALGLRITQGQGWPELIFDWWLNIGSSVVGVISRITVILNLRHGQYLQSARTLGIAWFFLAHHSSPYIAALLMNTLHQSKRFPWGRINTGSIDLFLWSAYRVLFLTFPDGTGFCILNSRCPPKSGQWGGRIVRVCQ